MTRDQDKIISSRVSVQKCTSHDCSQRAAFIHAHTHTHTHTHTSHPDHITHTHNQARHVAVQGRHTRFYTHSTTGSARGQYCPSDGPCVAAGCVCRIGSRTCIKRRSSTAGGVLSRPHGDGRGACNTFFRMGACGFCCCVCAPLRWVIQPRRHAGRARDVLPSPAGDERPAGSLPSGVPHRTN